MSLESAAIALDARRAKRLMIDGSDVDAWNESHQDDYAKIRPVGDFRAEVASYFEGGESMMGATLPWQKTHSNFRVRSGEVTLWHGINGHGKSLVLNHVLVSLMAQGESAAIMSLEMRPLATLARMIRQAIGVNDPSLAGQDMFFEWAENLLRLYDQHGTVRPDRALAVARYAAHELKSRQIVIDSLMKCGMGEDEYNKQKAFVDGLCAIAKDTGCHIHLVHHSRKGANEDDPPGKMDAKGSGSIADQVDNMISVWRNKIKERKVQKGEEDSGPDCMLGVDKQRHGEWEGKIALWFDRRSLQYLESEKWPVRSLIEV